MRWPFMLKRTHDRKTLELTEAYQASLFDAQLAIDNEYARATREGRAQVHAWARDATWNVFHGGQAQAAFQEAEHMFAPPETDVKEILSAPASA